MKLQLTYKGLELVVWYSWQPAEHSNGIKEHVDEITCVLLNGIDITSLVEDDEEFIGIIHDETIKR